MTGKMSWSSGESYGQIIKRRKPPYFLKFKVKPFNYSL
jgi:hypothetical protein